MEQKNLNYIVLAFVFLIIGSALIGQVATNTNLRTSKLNVIDEAHDISGARCINNTINESDSDSNITITYVPTGWKIADCPLTSLTYGNSTTDYELATDYEVYSFGTDGIIHVKNTTTTIGGGNATLADYTHCSDDYLNSSFGRSVLGMIAGFFALALLGGALWLFYNVFRETGIIGR